MEHVEAFAAIQAQQNNTFISPADVSRLLDTVRGTTFATIAYVTTVKPAAAHKDVLIQKVTVAGVQLFNNLNEFTNVYENAVKRSATKLGEDATAVANFESAGNWYEHTACHSVVKHKTKEAYYLWAIYNRAESLYVIGNNVVSKQEVAQYLTPASARDLLADSDVQYNVGQDLEHSVVVRVVGLQNIVSIIAQKDILLV